MKVLNLTQQSIRPGIALAIAFETINAMAKTAPMLPRHFEEWKKEVLQLTERIPKDA
jgi:hypothetical protein